MHIKTDILIIGAGLSGLSLAYFLREQSLKVTLVEARPRIGGRISTTQLGKTATLEMGATWLGKKHQSLIALLEELELEIFEQILGEKAIYEPISTSPHQLVTLPPNSDPSFRIKGGSSRLIQKLASYLSEEQLYLNAPIRTIEEKGDTLWVTTPEQTFEAQLVVSTLPPFLFTQTISTSPSLPEELLGISRQTHTWMGESIKIALTYEQPFWRTANSSGTLVSNVGPIPELYDHSNYENSFFALKGFLNGSYFSVTKEERLTLILNQLKKYYGEQVTKFTRYEEAVWRKEQYTFTPYPEHVLPHQHNGHPIYRQAYLNGKLWIAGSETADQFPGYMDGAVRSARFIEHKLKI